MSSLSFLLNPILISGLFMTSLLTNIAQEKIMHHDHAQKGNTVVWSIPFWKKKIQKHRNDKWTN